MPHADTQLRRRICPFISSGQFIVYCRGSGCNGAMPILIEEDTFWVCVLIEGMRQLFPGVPNE